MNYYFKIVTLFVFISCLGVGCKKINSDLENQTDPSNSGLLVSNQCVYNQNNILHFKDEKCMKEVYDELQVELDNYEVYEQQNMATILANEAPMEANDQMIPDEPVLDKFEDNLQFRSWRRYAEEEEFAFLSQEGNTPSQFKDDCPLMDDIFASFVNPEGLVFVGKALFYVVSQSLTYIITDGDLATVKAIKNGVTPLKNVIVKGGGGVGTTVTCDASFDIAQNQIGQSVVYTFKGEPKSGATLTIDWGDGSLPYSGSPIASLTHVYTVGTYTIKSKIVKTGTEPCNDEKTQTVTINDACPVSTTVNFDPLQGFIYCYAEESPTVGNSSWNWSLMPTGGTMAIGSSNQRVTKFKAPCSGAFDVSLSYSTQGGCNKISTTTINITILGECRDGSVAMTRQKGFLFNNGNNEVQIQLYAQNDGVMFQGNKSRIGTKMWHYQKNSRGKFRKKRGNLEMFLGGNIYFKEKKDDVCFDKVENLNGLTKSKNNARKFCNIFKDKPENYYRSNIDDLWWAIFSVNGNTVVDTRSTPNATLPVDCK